MQLFCRRKLEEDDRERERQENAEKLKKVERRMEREQRRRAAKAKQKDQVLSMFFTLFSTKYQTDEGKTVRFGLLRHTNS